MCPKALQASFGQQLRSSSLGGISMGHGELRVPARNSTGNLLLSLGNADLLQGERRTHTSLVQEGGKASPAFGGSSWKISVWFLITPSLSAGA